MTSPSPSEPRTTPLYHAAFSPVMALMLAALAVATIYTLQIGLAGAGLVPLVAVTGSYTVVIALLVAPREARARVGLRRVPGRFLVGAVLVGLSMWFFDLWLVLLIRPPGDTKPLEGLVQQTALVPTVLAVAVMPAIGEELIFRGLLARSLATRLPAAVAVLASAALFSLYHVMPMQMVATFPLGLVLAFLALRSDSVVPGMLAHLLNNLTAILLSRQELPGLDRWLSGHPAVMVGGATVGVVAGLALAARGVA